jgi:tetratricopeptide (TPR) repeat protein
MCRGLYRRLTLITAMLLGIAIFQSVNAPSADAWHWRHWGWRHRWVHHWGWGPYRWHGWHRHWVYRPWIYRRPVFCYGGGYPIYNYNHCYYPSVSYGYYPTYGYYDGCQIFYQPSVSQPVYETQVVPGPQQDVGAIIAQVASVLRERRANNPDGRLLAGDGRLLGGIGNGRLRGVVQNIVGGVVQNQPLDQSTITNVRFSNPDARSKARAYITQGDKFFRDQRYAAAAQQYRAAASMAPDLAEAHWRYAHTLVAMSEYDLAVNAVDRALAADGDITRSGFQLDSLYGEVGTAKASHLEGLARVALESDSPNAYFLLGLTLHYSGETERAEKFFARAAQLQGRDIRRIAAFLPPASEPPPLLARVPAKEI